MLFVLITGTPGAGKTLKALQLALSECGVKDQSSVEAIRQGMLTATRPLYVWGVEGLKPGLFEELADPMDWQSCPDGSLIVIDEAWKVWGSHLPKVGADPRYLALAEHRHRGIDLVMTCQAPTQMHAHVKSLVDSHLHVARKFGSSLTVVWSWPSIQASPNSEASKNRGIENVWKHPSPIFDLYQSATVHTVKRRLPFKVIAAVLALPVIAGLLFFASKAALSIGKDAKPEAVASSSSSGAIDGSSSSTPMTPVEWLDRFSPRVAHIPMSAPAYDDREVVAEPRAYCVIGGAGDDAQGNHRAESCRCITDQGTPWTVPEAVCRAVVTSGGTYDHFKPPAEERPSNASRGDFQPTGRSAAAPVAGVIQGEQVTGYGDLGVGSQSAPAP